MFLDDQDNIEYIVSKEEYDHDHKGCDDICAFSPTITLSDIGECQVYINGYAGNTPHFEIRSLDGKFHTCIKLYESEYYFRDHTEFSKLSDKQIDELIVYLNTQQYIANTHATMSIFWKNMNDGKKYEHYNEGYIVPDYNKLKEGL